VRLANSRELLLDEFGGGRWQHTLERFLVCMQRDPLAALGLGQQYFVMVPRDRLSQIHPAAVNRASLCPITRALTAEAIHVRPERGSA
jgi:hypothetical protein